ncbi:MAG: hypothetical protein JSS87_08475 [Acidobacteria bacterium]|nr:hypothetical protein [Acidobacteriota bacterium]
MLHPNRRMPFLENKGPSTIMKSILFAVAGICAAAAGWIVWGPKRMEPVQQLAESLEHAWADHHTVA